MMNKFLLAALLPLVLAFSAGAQSDTTGYRIRIRLKPFHNQYVYLGHYYGNQYPIDDSALLNDQGEAEFHGSRPLGGGVYLVGYPDKKQFFEILLDKQQHFTILADTSAIPEGLRFINSPDNELFNTYQKYVHGKGRSIDEARARLAAARTPADSTRWKAVVDTRNRELHAYRENLVKTHPGSLLATLLTAMREPEVPPAGRQPGGRYDSVYVYHYYKNHFWDGVNFYDDRLTRTSFFDTKLNRYFQQLVYPDPDSVNHEIDWMMGYASVSPEMQKFLLLKFVNRYINQQYMWEDKVFVHLFEKYFSNQHYPWLNKQGEETIANRAYSLMANILGSFAADISLPDTAGNLRALSGEKAPYTLVCFWDPTCGHCKATLPLIDSVYRSKWKALGVHIFAVGRETEGTRADWMKFIHEHHLEDWTHVFDSKQAEQDRVARGNPSYAQLYDIQVFPTLYLLDADKRIIAKKLTFEQMDLVLKAKTAKP
ncbi:MAG TPA: DUF5106 domain-containing protein [Chitinophagaceae bacterium]|nr:DUF5106 domain-containing protein [Chitinophagaceae bacterium]